MTRKLDDAHSAGLMTRRDLGKLFGGASVAAVAAATMPHGAWATDYSGAQLVFAGWGGIYQDSQKTAFCDPFEEKTGATVIQDGPVDYARIRIMVQNKQPIWNVVDVGSSFLHAGSAEGLFEPIDPAIVDLSKVDPLYQHEFGVGTNTWSYVLGYNTDVFSGKDRPRTWADLFDVERFPGRRMLRDRPNPNLEVALLADGVAPEDLYPLDVERALAKLDSVREHFIFWSTNSQSQQLISDGEVSMGLLTHGRVYDLHQKGAPIGVEWHNTLVSIEYLVVPKGARDRDASMALINEMLTPYSQKVVGEAMAGGPTNAEAFEIISDEARSWMPSAPANAETAVMMDDAYWRDNLDRLEQEWLRWKLG